MLLCCSGGGRPPALWNGSAGPVVAPAFNVPGMPMAGSGADEPAVLDLGQVPGQVTGFLLREKTHFDAFAIGILVQCLHIVISISYGINLELELGYIMNLMIFNSK